MEWELFEKKLQITYKKGAYPYLKSQRGFKIDAQEEV